jgi:hypothetical protein
LQNAAPELVGALRRITRRERRQVEEREYANSGG